MKLTRIRGILRALRLTVQGNCRELFLAIADIVEWAVPAATRASATGPGKSALIIIFNSEEDAEKVWEEYRRMIASGEATAVAGDDAYAAAVAACADEEETLDPLLAESDNYAPERLRRFCDTGVNMIIERVLGQPCDIRVVVCGGTSAATSVWKRLNAYTPIGFTQSISTGPGTSGFLASYDSEDAVETAWELSRLEIKSSLRHTVAPAQGESGVADRVGLPDSQHVEKKGERKSGSCYYCQKEGHFKRNCFKRKRDLTQRRGNEHPEFIQNNRDDKGGSCASA